MMTILFDEAETRGEAKGRANILAELIKKKIARRKSFDQIVDECESTPEEVRPVYDSIMAEMTAQKVQDVSKILTE